MLLVYLLGAPEIRNEDNQLIEFKSQAALEVLAYLSLHPGQAVSRAQLAGRFWSDSSEANARANLRSALHALREKIEPTANERGTFVEADSHSIRLRENVPCWIDVVRFKRCLREAEEQNGQERLKFLEEAVSLYRGDLLEGHYADWCLEDRDRLRTRYAQVLRQLSETHAQLGQYERAIEHERMLLEVKPLDEQAHRRLMFLHYANHDRSSALRQYHTCAEILEEELGVDTAPETAELHDQIQRNVELESLRDTPDWLRGTRRTGSLPHPIARFIGREEEITTIEGLLRETRLLTLTGAGGSGKTRLALEVAHRQQEAFADGAAVVDFGPLSQGDALPQTVATGLNIELTESGSDVSQLARELGSRQLLLVFDNCEHLIPASSDLVNRLLQSCPDLTILATSREPLGLIGETTWEVPPLKLPRGSPDPRRLKRYDAVQLFLERARAHQQDLRLTDQNAEALLQICRRLDGLPLAIELAAARVKSLSVDQIAERLDDRFRVLTSGGRGSLPRHQTLRATMDWSYQLLCEREQTLLRRLSVFVGGFTLEVAEAVCSDDQIPETEVLDLLCRLVEKSLVQFDGERYRLLETVREYGAEKLHESEVTERLHEKHFTFFSETARRAEPREREDECHPAELKRDLGNFKKAFRWALGQERFQETVDMAAWLWPLWFFNGPTMHEGRRWFTEVLTWISLDELPDDCGSWSTVIAGFLEALSGDYARGRQLLDAGITGLRELGARHWLAHSLWLLGMVEARSGHLGEGIAHHEEAIEIYRTVGDDLGLSRSLNNLAYFQSIRGGGVDVEGLLQESINAAQRIGHTGWLPMCSLGEHMCNQGKWERGQQLLEDAAQLAAQVGHDEFHLGMIVSLGEVARVRGDQTACGQYLDKAEARIQELGHRLGFARDHVGQIQEIRARLALDNKDLQHAEQHLRRALQLHWELSIDINVVSCIEAWARWHLVQGNPEWAARLYGSVDAQLEVWKIHYLPAFPHFPVSQADHDATLSTIREQIDEEAFRAAYAEGRTLSLDTATKIAYREMG